MHTCGSSVSVTMVLRLADFGPPEPAMGNSPQCSHVFAIGCSGCYFNYKIFENFIIVAVFQLKLRKVSKEC